MANIDLELLEDIASEYGYTPEEIIGAFDSPGPWNNLRKFLVYIMNTEYNVPLSVLREMIHDTKMPNANASKNNNVIQGYLREVEQWRDLMGALDNSNIARFDERVRLGAKIKDKYAPFTKDPKPCNASKSWEIKTPDGTLIVCNNLREFCRQHSINQSSLSLGYKSKGYSAKRL